MSAEPKIALVTGAYKGIGLEVVRQLAARGVCVYLTARHRAAGEIVRHAQSDLSCDGSAGHL